MNGRPEGTFLLLFAVPIPVVAGLGAMLAKVAGSRYSAPAATIAMGLGALYLTLFGWAFVPWFTTGTLDLTVVIIVLGLFVSPIFLILTLPMAFVWTVLVRDQVDAPGGKGSRMRLRVCLLLIAAAMAAGTFRLSTAFWIVPQEELGPPLTTLQMLGIAPLVNPYRELELLD